MSRIMATADETAISTTWLLSLDMEKAAETRERGQTETRQSRFVCLTLYLTSLSNISLSLFVPRIPLADRWMGSLGKGVIIITGGDREQQSTIQCTINIPSSQTSKQQVRVQVTPAPYRGVSAWGSHRSERLPLVTRYTSDQEPEPKDRPALYLSMIYDNNK